MATCFVVSVVVGALLLILGVLEYRRSSKLQKALESGNWSVSAVAKVIGIASDRDLSTKKERALYCSFAKTNDLCLSVIKDVFDSSITHLAAGVWLLFSAIQCWVVLRRMEDD